MKKLFTIMLILILAASMLTACSGNSNSGSGSSTGSSTPPASNNGGNSGTQTNTSGSEKPGEIKAPDITVKPGDVVFKNNIVTIFYEEIAVDSISMDICLQSINHSTQEITITTSDLVINDASVGIGYTFTNISPGKSDDQHWIILTHKNLEIEGFSAENIETVQITFTVTPLGKKDVLFEGAALFNIE